MPNEMNPQEVAENPIKIIPELETAEMLEKLASVFPNGEQIMFAVSVLRRVASGEYAPVVHGKWLNFTGDFSTAECDKCGEVYEVSPDEKPCKDYFNAFKQSYKFCPGCGAIMDESDMGIIQDGKDDSHE